MLSGLAARLGAGYFTLFVFTGLMGPYLGLWLDGLGLDATTIGLLLALLAATKVGASTLWAWLGDHTGRRATLVKAAAALAALASLGFLVAHEAWSVALTLFVCASFWNALAPQLEVLTLHGVGSSRYSRVRVWGSIGFIAAVLGGGAVFIVALVAAVWLASGFYIVDEGRRGVVLRLGRYLETTMPGRRAPASRRTPRSRPPRPAPRARRSRCPSGPTRRGRG